MSQKKVKELKKQEEMVEKVSVDMFELPSGLHFSAYFSFNLDLEQPIDVTVGEVDSKITNARNEILKKVAEKMGVKLNFLD